MPGRRTLAAAALAVIVADPASAQVGRDGYRTDVPGVVAPPPRPRPPEMSPFERAYARAERPRVILFMNRDMAEETRSGATVARREETVVEGRASDRSDQPAEGRRSGEAEVRLREKTTSEVRVVRPAIPRRDSVLVEAELWAVEGAFTRTLAAPGLRLADREAAIRVAGGTGVLDARLLETLAMRGLAEVAVTLRHAPAPDGSLVWRTRATATRDGRVLADVVMAESDVAGGRTALGEEIARRTLSELVKTWGR